MLENDFQQHQKYKMARFWCFQQVDTHGIGFNKARTDSFIFKFTLSDIMNPQISFLIVYWSVSNQNDQKQNELWLLYQLKISKMPPIPPISTIFISFRRNHHFVTGLKSQKISPVITRRFVKSSKLRNKRWIQLFCLIQIWIKFLKKLFKNFG